MKLPINEIVCGDCLEVMKDWPDGCIDMAISSPPYGNLRDYKGYVFDFKGIAQQLFRITKQGGVVVWVVGDQTINGSESGESFRQALYFKSIGFNLHDTMIYQRQGCFPSETHHRYWQDFEYMFILSKINMPVAFNPIKELAAFRSSGAIHKRRLVENIKGDTLAKGIRHKYKSISNVWKMSCGGGLSSKDENAFEHPAIFPEQLAKNHIISWSNPDDIILDPMNGSGTSCKMAKILGRRYIGIDISEEYCEIARQRIRAVETGVPVKEQRQGQMGLFE